MSDQITLHTLRIFNHIDKASEQCYLLRFDDTVDGENAENIGLQLNILAERDAIVYDRVTLKDEQYLLIRFGKEADTWREMVEDRLNSQKNARDR